MPTVATAPCVLFIDDERALVTLGSAMLRVLGFACDAHASPEQALAAFRARPDEYCAAFTDLTMPTLSGFVVARELLQLRSTLPVFVMSGNLARADKLALLELGVRDTVLKPFTMEQLRGLLASVLGAPSDASAEASPDRRRDASPGAA